MLLQVHDEIVFEIKNEKVDKVAPEIKKIMENVVKPADIAGVKCVAEYGVGDNWSEL